MTLHLQEPTHMDEPLDVKEYADVLSRVAADHQAVIMRRGGTDLAAIIPMDLLELLQETLAMNETQRLLKSMNLARMAKENPPPQSWFDGEEPKPF